MNNELSEHEIDTMLLSMETDFSDEERSDSIEAYETFSAAKSALFANLKNAMAGEGESVDEVTEYIKLLLVETSQGFANAAQTFENRDELVTFAAQAFHLSFSELHDLIATYDTNIVTTLTNVDHVIEFIDTSLDSEQDKNAQFETLEQLFGNTFADAITVLLTYRSKNKNDVQRSKREMLKYQAIDVLKDATKIALGATVAVLVTRISRKE